MLFVWNETLGLHCSAQSRCLSDSSGDIFSWSVLERILSIRIRPCNCSKYILGLVSKNSQTRFFHSFDNPGANSVTKNLETHPKDLLSINPAWVNHRMPKQGLPLFGNVNAVFYVTSCWLGVIVILWGPKANLGLWSSHDWSILWDLTISASSLDAVWMQNSEKELQQRCSEMLAHLGHPFPLEIFQGSFSIKPYFS